MDLRILHMAKEHQAYHLWLLFDITVGLPILTPLNSLDVFKYKYISKTYPNIFECVLNPDVKCIQMYPNVSRIQMSKCIQNKSKHSPIVRYFVRINARKNFSESRWLSQPLASKMRPKQRHKAQNDIVASGKDEDDIQL